MALDPGIIERGTRMLVEGNKPPDILGQYQKLQALRTMGLQQQDIQGQIAERNAQAAKLQEQAAIHAKVTQAILDSADKNGEIDWDKASAAVMPYDQTIGQNLALHAATLKKTKAEADKAEYELKHPKIDPLSPEGIAANIATKKGEPRNIDPLSPEGVAATIRRTTAESQIPNRPQGIQQPPQPAPAMSPALFDQQRALRKITVDAAAASRAATNPGSNPTTVAYLADQVEANPQNWNLVGGDKKLQQQVRDELAVRGRDVNRLTAATRQLGETADTVVPKIDSLIKKLDNPKFVENLGPIMGRWNEFWTGTIGTNDPDLAALRAQIGLTQTGVMRAHVGARGGEGLLQKFESLADSKKMDAATLKGSLTGLRDFLQGYRERIHPAKTPVQDRGLIVPGGALEKLLQGK